MWFQRYEFLKDPPLHFMGEALGILYNQTFFCSGLEHLFIRWMQPTFYMLCLTCPCHHRNDQLSASWQDYLDTSYWLHKLYPIFGECIGSTSGHARNTGILAGCLDLVNSVYFYSFSVHFLWILLLGLNPKVRQQATCFLRSLRCTCFYLSSLCPQTWQTAYFPLY